MEKYKSLQVSFSDMELDSKIEEELSDLGCYINLKSENEQYRFVDVVVLSDTQNIGQIPITNNDDSIQFIIKRMSINKVIGSVSIKVKLFKSIEVEEWPQWLTLFDDQFDDSFDGNLFKEDDEQLPRARIIFKLMVQEIQSPSPFKSPSQIGTPQNLQSASSSCNQYNYSGDFENLSYKEQSSPKFDTCSKQDFSCQANIDSSDFQQIFLLRLELEKMIEYKRKYEQSKKILQKVQTEYRDLYNLFNNQMEEKDDQIQYLSNQVCELKQEIFGHLQQLILFQSEFKNPQQFQCKASEDQEKSYHTFQYVSKQQNSSNRIVIQDLNEQIVNLNVSLKVAIRISYKQQQSEQFGLNLQDKYSKLADQFNLLINESTTQKFQILVKIQQTAEFQNQSQQLIKRADEKSQKIEQELIQKKEEFVYKQFLIFQQQFLEKEIQRLVSDCEWNQSSMYSVKIFNVNYKQNKQLEEMRLGHIQELNSLNQDLTKALQEINDLDTECKDSSRLIQIMAAQLNSFLSVVGTLDNFVSLINKGQESEFKKSQLLIQLTESQSKASKQLEQLQEQSENQRLQIKEKYEAQIKQLKQQISEMKPFCKEGYQEKELQMEVSKLNLSIQNTVNFQIEKMQIAQKLKQIKVLIPSSENSENRLKRDSHQIVQKARRNNQTSQQLNLL